MAPVLTKLVVVVWLAPLFHAPAVASGSVRSSAVTKRAPEDAASTPSDVKSPQKPTEALPVDVKAAPAESLEGLWPSKKLMNLLLARRAHQAAARYELNEEQQKKVREAVVGRWGRFLTENRATLQPLANEFIEMRMELEPPSKEQVQAWAKRAMPVFGKVREQLEQGIGEFREILDPLQRAKFELDAMRFGVGLQITEQRLENWQQGEFETSEFWQPPGERRRRREERRRRRGGSERAVNLPGAPGRGAAGEVTPSEQQDQIALELHAWEKFVEEFIRIYGLDGAQRDAARSCLSEVKERALAHRDRRREDIVRLEGRIRENTGAEEELADIKKRLVELYGPIDAMFAELKRRIEQIPTAKQRARITQRDRQGAPASAEQPGESGTDTGDEAPREVPKSRP